ncbi:MAG: TraB/GumN family protein [Crocinitomicaceae bacterium]
MSKKSFSLFGLLLMVVLNAPAQNKSYQGLLWEISGNGLETPSFLYGTMHVSNKLAFNVSDSFYYSLNSVDAIALESSPADWMEDYREMGAFDNRGYGYDGFYKDAFKIKPPSSDLAYQLMENKNGLMNQILYRFRPGNEDYQEDTFLDMFIFQAGAKNSKPIYALETLEEVVDLSIKAMTPDEEYIEDNSRNNFLENDGQRKFVLLEEAYRRGDLNAIDSLSKADNPTSVYHDYFIVERNKNMVRRIDSLLKDQSLFIGIGAAHLPGEEGAIELLRNMGYNVRPVNPKSTGKSHKMRKKLESLYRPVDFQPFETEDEFINVSVPGNLYRIPTGQRGKMEYLCPEPINGGYFSVVRRFTFGGIFNKDIEHYKATFDSLLYIATPGELIKKEDITINGHEGYRILTLTSKNSYVNYNVFFTPTEIVVFKGYGTDDYILKSRPKTFFSEINLEPAHGKWQDVSPKFGGATWKMKGLVSSQDMIDGMDDSEIDPIFQSYDNETGNYYLTMRYSYNDLDYIEEDSFDLAYLGENFAKSIGYDIDQTIFKAGSPYTYVEQSLTVKKENNDQKETLRQKLITRAGYYFLMLTTAEGDDAHKFFDSFNFTDFKIDDEFETYTDTAIYYTAETYIKEELPEMPSGYYNRYREKDEEDNSFKSREGSNYHFHAKTGQNVYVEFVKFHDYDGIDSLEEFWDYRIEQLSKKSNMVVSGKSERTGENGDQIVDFVLTDTGSTKGIMTQMRLHNGVQYTVQALIDNVEGPSEYVQRFFDTFQPKDTIIGRDLMEDKAELFYAHAKGEDSLNHVNAMKSIDNIDFKEKDVKYIVDTYRSFEFDEEKEQEQREDLIMALGNIEVKDAYDFLYEVYDENNFNSDLQFIVLKCFSYTETQEAYDAIKKLLLKNPPFTEDNKKLKFFDNLYDSLELADKYYPEMLEMSQYADYHPYVLELLATGYLDSIFNFNHFKSEKSQIFRNANIELKRTVANQQEEDDNQYNYSYFNQYSQYHNLFIDYYTLMCGFKANGDKDADTFFKDIYRIEDKKFKVEAEIIHHKLGLAVDTSVIQEVAKDVEYRVWVYNRLEKNDMLPYFNDTITQEDMAFAILYNRGYDEEEDTVAFIKSVTIDDGKEIGTIYFFKRKAENKKNWMIDYVGLMPEDSTLLETRGMTTKKGLSIKNDEEMEETIEHAIKVFELAHRQRVRLDSYNYGSLFDGLF